MKLTNKIYSGVLAMLGFSACSIGGDPMYGPVDVVMYGPGPSLGFRVHGVVTADEKPVEGIRITVRTASLDSPHTIVAVKSGVDGKYVANWVRYDLTSLTLLVEDVDGEDNGGEFATQEVKLSADDNDTWTYADGSYTAEVDIVLVKKTTEEENGNESE